VRCCALLWVDAQLTEKFRRCVQVRRRTSTQNRVKTNARRRASTRVVLEPYKYKSTKNKHSTCNKAPLSCLVAGCGALLTCNNLRRRATTCVDAQQPAWTRNNLRRRATTCVDAQQPRTRGRFLNKFKNLWDWYFEVRARRTVLQQRRTLLILGVARQTHLCFNPSVTAPLDATFA